MININLRAGVFLLLIPVAAWGAADEDFARDNRPFATSAGIVAGLAARMRLCVEWYPSRRDRWSQGLADSTRWVDAMKAHIEDETARMWFHRAYDAQIAYVQAGRAGGTYTEEFCDKVQTAILKAGLPASFRKYVDKAELAARQPAKYPGYPEQDNMFTEPPFRRPDLETFARPASPAQVANAYGPEFASLPRLGVVLILVGNSGRDAPITVSRASVRLTPPDGRGLTPLGPSEMTAWLNEVSGATLGKDAKETIFGRHSEASNKEFETGVLTVAKGRNQGEVMVFRFPEGVRSGEFPIEYVLDLGKDGQIPVKQKVRLNLRP